MSFSLLEISRNAFKKTRNDFNEIQPRFFGVLEDPLGSFRILSASLNLFENIWTGSTVRVQFSQDETPKQFLTMRPQNRAVES